MKVDRPFTQFNLVLEYSTDVDFLVEVLRRARKEYLGSGCWIGHKRDDSFVQKCEYVEKLITK